MTDTHPRFVLKQADGSFVGYVAYNESASVTNPTPTSPMATAYTTPDAFRAFIKSAETLGKIPGLPKHAREVAVVTVGVYYESVYEIYAHETIANGEGITWRQLSYLKMGHKPPADGPDALDEHCSVAFDVANEMLRGSGSKGRLRDDVYNRAVELFGTEATLGLIHYVGYYSWACLLMNGAGIGLPKGESIKPINL